MLGTSTRQPQSASYESHAVHSIVAAATLASARSRAVRMGGMLETQMTAVQQS